MTNSRFLMYESTNDRFTKTMTDYGQIVQIISEQYINVNIQGARDANGEMVILEQVAVAGDYVPKLGDWVGIEWRNGQPVAIGTNNTAAGINDINNNVKIISPQDMTNNVVKSNHIQAESILARHIKAGEIQADHISANSIDATKIKAGEITSVHISANSIDTMHIKADAVTATQISANSVVAEKIASGAITTEKIAAGAITAVQISANAIDATRMKVGTITAASGILASASVGTANIIDGSITNAKIGNAEITGAKIANATIDTAQIKDAAITNAKIQDVSAGKITTGYLDTARIQAGSITGDLISANTITGDKIAARTIESGQIKAGAITTTELAAGSVTAEKIKAGTITGEQIHAGSISTEHISTVGLDARSIKIYNGDSGETLLGSGYIRVDGFDVGVVQSDNLVSNGLFLINSKDWGLRRKNIEGEPILGLGNSASGGNTIWAYDLLTTPPTLVTDSLLAGKKPACILISQDGTTAYVSNQGDGTVSKLNLMSGAEVATLSTGKEPTVMKFTSDGRYILVLNSDLNSQSSPDTVAVIDTITFTVVKELIVGSTPFDIVVSGNTAYISTGIDGDIYILETDEMKVVGAIPTGKLAYPTGMELSTDGVFVYVSHSLLDEVGKYDINSGELVTTVPVGDTPSFIERHNGKLYVAASGSNKVAVIDEVTFTVEASIDAGVKPVGLAVNPYAGTAGYLFVASSGINKVLIVDMAINAVIGYLDAGANVLNLAFSPDYRYLYMTNNGDSSFISFTYPEGDFIGDAYVSADGTTKYYGADYWMPNRSDRVIDGSGNIIGAASVEFHIGEPKNNEGGYAKLLVAGGVNQYAYIEQDIFGVTNFSDGVSPTGTWFKYHNISAQMMAQQPVAPNIVTKLEVDELVPKFIVVEDTQTVPFTPLADGVNQEYEGLVLSAMTNRALNLPTTSITSSDPAATGFEKLVDGSHFDYESNVSLASGNQWVQLDLGDLYMVNTVKMWRYYGDGRTYNGTKVEVSTDGVSWTTVYDQTISGGYAETPEGKTIIFPSCPARFVRFWSNGSSANEFNHWVELQVFGDWKLEMAPTTTILVNGVPTQAPMTNNGTHITTDVAQAYVEYNIDIEFLSDWYYTYISGAEYGTCRLYIDDASQKRIDGTTNLYIFQNGNSTMPQAFQGSKLKTGRHKIRIEQSSGKISFDRLRFDDFQYYMKSSTLFNSADTNWSRVKLVPVNARGYVGQGRQTTSGAFDTPRVNPRTGQPDGSVEIKYRVRVRTDLIGGGTAVAGVTYVTGVICETGKLHTHWRKSQSFERFPSEMLEEWSDNKPFSSGIQTKHIADGAVLGTKIKSQSLMDWHINPYAKIAEFKLDLSYPTHPHENKEALDLILGFSGNGVSNYMARADHDHNNLYYTKIEIDQRLGNGAGGSGDILASGNNIFYGTNTFMQTVTMMGDLNVSGNINYHGSSAIIGDQSITGSLTVGGALILNQQATMENHAVRADRRVNAGAGLTGGGNLTTDVTLSVAFSGNGSSYMASHSDHNHDNWYVRTDRENQTVKNGLTMTNGTMYLGTNSSGNSGSLVLRNNLGLTSIQIDGAGSGMISGVKSYIGADGSAKFASIVQVGSLKVDDSTLVQKLNAQFLNGKRDTDFVDTLSIVENLGSGVLNGLVMTQTAPTPTNAVTISAGVVYTKSGRRVSIPQQNVTIPAASAVGDRYDYVYISGSSDPLGDGVIRVLSGAVGGSFPTLPSDAILLGYVHVRKNNNTFTDGKDGTPKDINSQRYMKSIYADSTGSFVSGRLKTGEITPVTDGQPIGIGGVLMQNGASFAGEVLIPAGQTVVEVVHGYDSLPDYYIFLSCNSPHRHVYWNKTDVDRFEICLDDAYDYPVTVNWFIVGTA